MKETKKSPVNRCFRGCPKNPKRGGKAKSLPLTRQQKNEEIKRILLASTEKKRRNRANKEIEYLLQRHRGKSLLQLLLLIKQRHPFWLMPAIERVEDQKNRNELNPDEVKWFEAFKKNLPAQKE